MQTPEHLSCVLQTRGLDVHRALVTGGVHGDVEDVSLAAPLDNLILDHRHPVVAGDVGLVLPVEHVPHLETAGGGRHGGGHLLVAGEGAALPARTHGVSGGHVRPLLISWRVSS